MPRSLYQLEADTLAIYGSGDIASYENLTSAPFAVVAWAPESVSGTVQFSVIGNATQAQSTLSQLFPSIPISVVASSSLTLPTPVSTRYNDSQPWSSGDRIDVAGHSGDCSSNFGYVGNASGNRYAYTAAHCSGNGVGAQVTQAGQTAGYIATIYNNGTDFASYPCNCQGRVWYDGSGDSHSVIGWCNCYSGNLVTMDGEASGEQPDFTVQWSAPGCDGSTCGLEYATNSSRSGCNGGDSGGPVYQRAANNSAYATGLLLYQGSNSGQCYYQAINVILSDANVSLLHGS